MKRLLIILLLIAPIVSHAQAVQESMEKLVLDWMGKNVADTCTIGLGKFDPHTVVCSNGMEQKWIWNQMIYAKLAADKKAADSLKVHYDAFRCDTTGYNIMYEFSYISKEKKQYEVLLSATTDRSLVIEEIIYYDFEGITEIPARLIYQRRKKAEHIEQEEK